MLLNEILHKNARLYGDETALVEIDPVSGARRTITWSEFLKTANRVAEALAAKGVVKGDRVVLLLKNSLEWLPVYFGILATGGWAVPLNHRFSPEEASWCARTAEAKAFFFGEEYSGHFAPEDYPGAIFVSVGEAPGYAVTLEEFISGAKGEPPSVELSGRDEAGLYFTSGTTGRPKPILLTHDNLYSACLVERSHHGQTREDNFLCIPPLYHTGAKMHWFGNLLAGAPAVILKGAKPEWILDAVSREGCTIVWLLVPWAQDILDALEEGSLKLSDYNLSQWRLMHIGAQPVPPSLIKRWLKVFPNHSYDTNYGLSEATGPGAVHLGVGNVHKVGAIGIPGEGWETLIVDAEKGTKVAEGETGELLLKGPGVMRCYYRNPEATALAFDEEGWLRTGDLCRRDEDGFIYLVDRKKDLVIVGGENVFPVEVEDFLRSIPKVRDAAVIGAPHERLGEVVVAIVDASEEGELTEKDILARCAELPRYKRPVRVHFDSVPRNPTGKIEKPKLREKYGKGED